MASGGPPDALNSRHYEIAALDAAGYTNVEIARITSSNANRISIVKQSPLYQALLSLERKKLQDCRRDSVVGRMEELTDLAFTAKRDCLEQRENLSVANAAADSVLDRVLPKVKEDVGERVLHVKLSVDEATRLRRVMLEDADDIDVTPPGLTPIEEAIVDAVAPPEEDDDEDAVA